MEIFGISGWDPSVCKSNRSHVDNLRFSFINLVFLYYSMNSSKMIGEFPAISNFNRLFLTLNRFIVTNCRFSSIIGLD